MKLSTAAIVVSVLFAQVAFAASPEYKPIEGWLKPTEQSQSIGSAHGDVAVAANGDVYVSIMNGPRAGIQVYNAEGEYLRNVPNAPNDFHGFVIHKGADGEFIYGSGLGSGNVFKMQLDGKVVLEIAGSKIPEKFKNKNKEGQPVLRLTAVDVAPDGRIFAVDGYSSDYIHIFDSKGEYQSSFGGKQAPYSFKTCHKIAIDTRFDPPQILCCDRENRRVVHLSIDGKVLGVTPEMKRPAAVAVHGDWAAVGEIEGRVSLIDKAGKTVATVGSNPVKEQTATNKVKPTEWKTGILTAPHGLDFDLQGNLVVTEYNEFGRVLRYSLESGTSG